MKEILGNAAKAYCLAQIERSVGPITILDMGCGDGRNFVSLLKNRADIRYIGIDPHHASVDKCRSLLPGHTIHHGNAENFTLEGGADIIVSFSVLEHVIARRAYMAAVARNLKPNGKAFINYDSGHFTTESTSNPAHTMIRAGRQAMSQMIRNVLARLRLPFSYERFVTEDSFAHYCADVNLDIVDSKSFNTPLKYVFRNVPVDVRAEFCSRWLDFELWLNEHCQYSDSLAPTWMSRCHMLTRRALSI